MRVQERAHASSGSHRCVNALSLAGKPTQFNKPQTSHRRLPFANRLVRTRATFHARVLRYGLLTPYPVT